MQQQTEDIDVTLPSGERISATIPAGLNDQQAKAFMRTRRPELFGAQPSATSGLAQASRQPSPAPATAQAGFQIPSPGLTGSQMVQPAQPAPTATISAREPDIWDRLRSALPVVDRIQSGLSGPAGSNLEAVAKPAPGMSDERALAPEQLMTPTQQQAHPVATGALEFAGGLTTPENTLTMLMMGKPGGGILAPVPLLHRAVQAGFAGAMVRGAVKQIPDLQAAVARGDSSEAKRILTHVGLGVIFGGLTARQAILGEMGAPGLRTGTTVFEEARNRGRAIADVTRRAKTLDDIHRAGALSLGKQIQEPLITLQEKLKQDGIEAMRGAVEADERANIAGRGTIAIGPAVAAGEQALDSIGHTPTPQTQKVRFKLASKSDLLTLDEARQLRSEFGTAAAKAERAANTRDLALLVASRNELGNSMKARMNELQGGRDLTAPNQAFNDYNKNFTAHYELNKGSTGELLEPILDHHESIPKLEKFSNASLTQIADQMRTKGLDPDPFLRAQRDAAAIVSAHKSVMGKMSKGLYGQVMQQTPSEAMLPLGVYMASKGAGLYGFVPYLLATMAGKVTGDVGRMTEAGRILRKLDVPQNQKYLNLRTEVPPTRTYDYPSQDDLYKPPSGGSGSGQGPTRGDTQPPAAKGSAAASVSPVDVEEVRRRAPAREDVSKEAKAIRIQNLRAKSQRGDFAARRELRDLEDTEKGIPPVKEVSSFERQEKRAKIAKLKGVK
jgi:hypothetical protein